MVERFTDELPERLMEREGEAPWTERCGVGVKVLRGVVPSLWLEPLYWRPTVVRVLLWREPPKLPFWLL